MFCNSIPHDASRCIGTGAGNHAEATVIALDVPGPEGCVPHSRGRRNLWSRPRRALMFTVGVAIHYKRTRSSAPIACWPSRLTATAWMPAQRNASRSVSQAV